MSQKSQSGAKEGSSTKYSDDQFIDAIQHLGCSASTSEISSIVGCTRRMADNRLRELAGSEQIKKETVGNSLLWRHDGKPNPNKEISGYFSNYIRGNLDTENNSQKGMVITIRRPHSQDILSGEKNIEFRRTRIGSGNIPSVGFVYEPAPTKAIVSTFRIDSIERHPVDYLYKIGPAKTPSTEESLREYFSGKDTGTAIFIDDMHPIDPPIPLKKNEHDEWIFNPPQDFYYVDPIEFSLKIRSYYENSDNPGGRSQELGEVVNTS